MCCESKGVSREGKRPRRRRRQRAGGRRQRAKLTTCCQRGTACPRESCRGRRRRGPSARRSASWRSAAPHGGTCGTRRPGQSMGPDEAVPVSGPRRLRADGGHVGGVVGVPLTWPDIWKCRYCFSSHFSGPLAKVNFLSLSYTSTMYSTMAPDSHRTRSALLGSLMAGVRPLGLRARNQSSLGFLTSMVS